MNVDQVFAALPRGERWFIRGRLASAPLALLAQRAPEGKVADVGCGHGALTALLAVDHPGRKVVGVDPDARKIAWARTALGGLANVAVRETTSDALAAEEGGSFDAVVVADVLYLLPTDAWGGFLRSCRALLRPGGVLLLKEAERTRSWKYFKCVAQEEVMVRLLRRTRGSGGLGFMPRAFTEGLLAEAGFAVEAVEDVSRGYSTPHVLFTARAPR